LHVLLPGPEVLDQAAPDAEASRAAVVEEGGWAVKLADVDLTELVERYTAQVWASNPESPPWDEVPPMMKFHMKEILTPKAVAIVKILRDMGVE